MYLIGGFVTKVGWSSTNSGSIQEKASTATNYYHQLISTWTLQSFHPLVTQKPPSTKLQSTDTTTQTGNTWKSINGQIAPNFTYRDLKMLLDCAKRDEHGVFKIQIGFASMLFDTVNEVYRYFYVFHNHYLFD